MKNIALIPARSGSIRVKDKNIRLLNGKPLMSYTIEIAKKSLLFDQIICVTDSSKYKDIAEKYGAIVPELRPSHTATSDSPDIEWVKWIRNILNNDVQRKDIFTILRPTSPFRSIEMLKCAKKKFISQAHYYHSLRAISECKEHPGKMWKVSDDYMYPILPYETLGVPWHSMQKASLPKIYKQTAGLEMLFVKTIDDFNSISGNKILPFYSNKLEAFDINDEEDWILAEYYMSRKI